MRKQPIPGEIWKHFKGCKYIILQIANHTETNEEFVIYKEHESMVGTTNVWARPMKMFMDRKDDIWRFERV